MATEHNESSPDTHSGSDSVSDRPGPPAKKKSRTTSSSNSTGNRHACFDHFNKLNEKYHTLNGNEDNDLSIPQENNLYFSRKQYVRNDKYTLANMLRKKDIELPSIMSAYRS